MSQRRTPPRSPIPRYTAPPSPFLSHQTITFLASWRGQLLVCTVVLILGAIYFFVRPPIDEWHRKRKEVLSRKRELELMSMSEKEDSVEEKDDVPVKAGSSKDKSKEKAKKEGRKRINSHLKPPTTEINGGNPVESSPSQANIHSVMASPSKSKRSLSNSGNTQTRSSSAKLQKATGQSKSQPQSQSRSHLATPSRNQPPPPIIVPKPCLEHAPTSIDPWNIPLPASPVAGPSRLGPPAGSGLDEVSDDASMSAEGEGSVKEEDEKPKYKKFEGFSIYPEDGYLPQSLNSNSNSNNNKKKKKKSNTKTFLSPNPPGSTGLPKVTASTERTELMDEVLEVNGHGVPRLPNGHGKHRHTRTSSITLLPNLNVTQLREIVEQRDETIDQLRAEIGMAKAEESKAKEEAVRARMGEEKIRGEYERNKRGRSESIGQGHAAGRREAELHSRLAQMQQLYSTALNRLSTCESALREQGIMLPPLPSPVPMHLPQSPLPPMPQSPYAPSPGRNTPIMGGFIPYPSPGMYPSPMLHPNPHYPHPHSHSPSPYRRTSSFTNGHGHGHGLIPVNGLSPGIMIANGGGNEELNGLYPMDIGSSTMPIGLGHPVSNGEQEEDRERRRQSIESSVLKKKVQQMTSVDVESTVNQNEDGQANGGSSNSNGTSGSVQDEESISNGSIVESNLGMGSGAASPKSGPSASSQVGSGVTGMPVAMNIPNGNGHGSVNGEGYGIGEIKVLMDSERGNVYYNSEDIEVGDGSVNGNLDANDANQQIDGEAAEEEEIPDTRQGEATDSPSNSFQPIFASLAHTPEQIEEMRKLNTARERGRSVSSLSSAGRGKGMGAGLGNGGLLTPSPSKSPVPLRG
ncbi:uncharacterized protein I303_100067 [Kwoniella dejecticola CBS 10117]|uniref:Uncharacterized protein n=1 Tax=Kwoniella dejecticola CBS 10117 TaxID=1296121 RepID=A0A1A6ADV8_9TREE|nr:uncharacterized protein I303_00067 [Kwoniella dejecticola CBS 10117]OBR88256.1 hypothetical protein I303_00067 [Kwoniella dejecticola CBS 10117]